MAMHDLEPFVMRYFRFLERQGRLINFLLGILCAAAIGIFDHFSPDEVISSFLYLLPISFVTWFAGKKSGVFIATICAIIWSIDNLVGSSLLVSVWNVFSISGVFWVIALLVAKIHQMFEAERCLSTKDSLTGVMNMRAFSEVVEYEILRLQRQCCAFSLAYLDLDNFKEVNDRYGHKRGDELLKSVVDCLESNLRKTDVVARAGGDEFIIFFPITGQDAVRVVMQKVRERLVELAVVNNWPITVSMGVLTCTQGVCALEEIINAADSLMYEVKASGKNNVRFAEFVGGDFTRQTNSYS